MAKYNYDRSVLKGLGVGPFLSEVKVRNAKIAEADDTLPESVFNANRLAKALHPVRQYARVAEVIDHGDARSYLLVADPARGTDALAYFRAGQYVSVALTIDGATLNKPYSLRSGPRDALGTAGTSYLITVRYSPNGYASAHILSQWTIGTEVTLSAPLGDFYYQRLRDARQVIALAGGSGITPFYSMACAIADGTEDFSLTILHGSRTRHDILLRHELEAVAARSGGKVRVVDVLSDEEVEGYEHGFFTAELVKKYAPEGEEYSLFVCGPGVMYPFVRAELDKLGLPRRLVRYELSGEHGDPTGDAAWPAEAAGKTWQLTVLVRGEEQVVPCRAEQSLLQAMESAGIRVPSECRSGQCGWCHSRLIAGEVYIPEENDGRRLADRKFGWIHPCSTYPLSDVSLEVFPLLD